MLCPKREQKLRLPDLDDNGDVVPHDHDEIQNDDFLIRRVNPKQHVVPDDNRGCRRISSKLFQPSSAENGGMSVDIKPLIEGLGEAPEQYVVTPVFLGAVEFSVDVARGNNLRVGYDPLPDNECHGEVWGSNRPNRFSGSQNKALHRSCRWLVELEDVELI